MTDGIIFPDVSGNGRGVGPIKGSYHPTPSGEVNVNATSLAKWRAGLSRVRAGTGRAKILCIGDSTCAGSGAGTGANQTLGAAAKGWPRQLGALLNARWAPVSDNSFFGEANMASLGGLGGYDTRIVLGTGWSSYGSAVMTIGGTALKFATGAVGTLTFTPAGAFDSIRIWYVRQTPGGSFTTDVDGGASLGTTSTAGGGQTVQKADFTVAKATHVIHINALNDAQIVLLGVETWDSTVPAIDLLQCGNHGSLATTWVGGAVWNYRALSAQVAPDLTICDLTINDAANGTPISTYKAYMQQIVDASLLTGSLLFMVGPPSNATWSTDGTINNYIRTLNDLATASNSGMVDINQRWVSYAVSSPFGYYGDTYTHPSAVGYQDIADAVYAAIVGP